MGRHCPGTAGGLGRSGKDDRPFFEAVFLYCAHGQPVVLKRIDRQMPEALDVHLVMDNYATDKTPRVKA